MNERTRKPFRFFIIGWMILLIGVAFYIRVQGADRFYYNPDEAMHASIAEGATPAQVLSFSRYEIHPPLSYLLLHYWVAFSTDPAFVRGFSLLFGLSILPVYYAIGKRLNGPLTGLACAAFAAFGNGFIIQSYVVRQYMVFVFFISVAFYLYLRWREERRTGQLLLYGLCALLACLSHFSAVFTVFCITVFELTRALRQKTPVKKLAPWIAVNGTVGSVALYVYYLWQPILTPLKSYFATHAASSSTTLLAYTLFYPLVSPGYILPDYTASIVFLGGLVSFAVARPRFVHNLTGLRSVLWLNAVAYALGMAMVATRIYPEPGTRHSLWIAPFVISASGWMFSDTLYGLAQKLALFRKIAFPSCGIAFLLLGWALYNPKERFKDSSEYAWPQKEWREFATAMQKLGPDTLIVTEKDDGILLANLYPAIEGDAFTGRHMAALMPYGKSAGILFNPYYPRNYSTSVMMATLRQAQAEHMMDRAQNLLFLRMAWSRSPLTDLMTCAALPRRMSAVPAFTPGATLNEISILSRYAVWMTIPKAELAEILSEKGEVHGCLAGKHDQVHDLVLPNHRNSP